MGRNAPLRAPGTPARRWPLALGALVASAAWAPLPGRADESVSFRFDWPTLRIATVRTVREVEYGSAAPLRVQGAYQFVVGRDGERWRVTVRPDGAQSPLDHLVPEFHVDGDGRFAGVADFEARQQELVRAFRARLPATADPFARARSERGIETVTSRAFLDATSAEWWDPLFGHWVGHSFVPDALYDFESDHALPALGVPALRARGELVVRSAPGCSRAGQARRCVYVEVTQRGLGPPEGGGLASLDYAYTLTLLVEPDGLVPHSLESERSLRYRLAGPAAGPERRQVERRIETFVYAD